MPTSKPFRNSGSAPKVQIIASVVRICIIYIKIVETIKMKKGGKITSIIHYMGYINHVIHIEITRCKIGTAMTAEKRTDFCPGVNITLL